jgi:4-hydroxyphenylpyruvate dioxygenase-like putative hemolysin
MIKGLHHVGVVYKDFSKIVEKIKDLFGMPQVPIQNSDVQVNTYIDGLNKPLKIRVGFASFGPTMIELFQPLDNNSIYSEYLEKNPEGGVHHVGYLVENIDEELEKWESRGIKKLIYGILPTNRFVYYDTIEMFGHVTELMDNVPPPPDMIYPNK